MADRYCHLAAFTGMRFDNAAVVGYPSLELLSAALVSGLLCIISLTDEMTEEFTERPFD